MSVVEVFLDCQPFNKVVAAIMPPNVRFLDLEVCPDYGDNRLYSPRIFESIGCPQCPRLISKSIGDGWYESKPHKMSDDEFFSLILRGVFGDAWYPEITCRDISNNRLLIECPLLDNYMVGPDIREQALPCQKDKCNIEIP